MFKKPDSSGLGMLFPLSSHFFSMYKRMLIMLEYDSFQRVSKKSLCCFSSTSIALPGHHYPTSCAGLLALSIEDFGLCLHVSAWVLN